MYFAGIVDDTDIYLKAEIYKINNSKRVSLQCSACRESRGNNVEFLVNFRSAMTVFYDTVTGKCSHDGKECHPEICSCLSTGNGFNASFPFSSDNSDTYSCDMQFKDDDTSMIFAKTANLRYNGYGLCFALYMLYCLFILVL